MNQYLVCVCTALSGAAAAIAGDSCAPTWDHAPGQPGLSNTVYALLAVRDLAGPGARLVAGGAFSNTGGSPVQRIGVWDGAQWSALGGGADGDVYALALFNDGSGESLYAAGNFTTIGGVSARRIARWDGAQWHALGAGVNANVYTMCVHDDGSGSGPALYVGGEFTEAGGGSAFRIARWSGGAWSTFSAGMSGSVRGLISWDDGSGAALYALGAFATAGGTGAANIARWNGAQWSALGAGLGGTGLCAAVEPLSGSLVVGGQFNNAGGQSALRIARWDGAQWSPMGGGMDATVRALRVVDLGDGDGPRLYAAGDFTLTGGVFAPRLVRWNGGAWASIQNSASNGVFALASHTPTQPGEAPWLAVSGSFTSFAGAAATRVARRVGCPIDEPLPPCPGDTNGDRVVDFTDFSAVLGAYGQSGPPGWVGEDLNGDGSVDFSDFTIVLSNFSASCD